MNGKMCEIITYLDQYPNRMYDYEVHSIVMEVYSTPGNSREKFSQGHSLIPKSQKISLKLTKSTLTSVFKLRRRSIFLATSRFHEL